MTVRRSLCALLALGVATAAYTPCGGPQGTAAGPDATGDGVVNILDASCVDSCRGLAASGACASSDTDGDGDVDQADFDLVVAHLGVLLRLAGELRAPASQEASVPPALDGADIGAVIGSFELVSAGFDDLRVAPGTATLTTAMGNLTATAVAASGPARRDPATGRPLRGDAPPGATCTTGAEPACLGPGGPTAQSGTAFDDLCALSKGFPGLDLSACSLDVYNSQVAVIPGAAVADFISNLLAGNPRLVPAFESQFLDGAAFPAVTPNFNVCDLEDSVDCVTFSPGPFSPLGFQILPGEDGLFPTLNTALTDQQDALHGCGRFFGSNCDLDGIQLFHAAPDVLLEAFVAVRPCTRLQGSSLVLLPGCRGPADAGWDPDVDGSPLSGNGHDDASSIRFCIPASPPPFSSGDFSQAAMTVNLVDPFTSQPFANELAAISFNHLLFLASQSGLVDTDNDGTGDTVGPGSFDTANPLRLEGCSYLKPRLCSDVRGLLAYNHHTARRRPAGRRRCSALGVGERRRVRGHLGDGRSGWLRAHERPDLAPPRLRARAVTGLGHGDRRGDLPVPAARCAGHAPGPPSGLAAHGAQPRSGPDPGQRRRPLRRPRLRRCRAVGVRPLGRRGTVTAGSPILRGP